MKRHWLLAFALVLAASCGENQPQSEAAERAVRLVDPGEVSAEALQAAVSDERVRRF